MAPSDPETDGGLVLAAPALTSVLAELEEAVGGLAARQRRDRPAFARSDSQDQVAYFAENPAAQAEPPARPPASEILESLERNEQVVRFEREGEILFTDSNLQTTIDLQIRALDDITNQVNNPRQGRAKRGEECKGEAFTDVRFLRHSRALPCRHCGNCFFPDSLKFHEAICARRVQEQLVACPRCSCELRRCELDSHLAKCGKALQRVLELSRRLDEDANACDVKVASVLVSSMASPYCIPVPVNKVPSVMESGLQPCRPSAKQPMTRARRRVNASPSKERAGCVSITSSSEAMVALVPPTADRHPNFDTCANTTKTLLESRHSDEQIMAGNNDPLVRIADLRKKVGGLCEELRDLPNAMDVMAAWQSSSTAAAAS